MASWESVVAIGTELPEVEEASSYGTPALKVRGKGFARLREALIQSDPRTFYVTPHYEGWPAMLIDLERVGEGELRERIIDSWCRKAPKRLLRAWESAQGS